MGGVRADAAVMRWRTRRIGNACAARQLLVRRDVIAPEFIFHGLVSRAINSKVCLRQAEPIRIETTPSFSGVVFAAETGLHADAAVELSLVEGTLVVQPLTPQPLTLDQLLRDVTDENLTNSSQPTALRAATDAERQSIKSQWKQPIEVSCQSP